MIRLFINLLKKEWLDSVRDKRAFTAAMSIAVLGPGMFAMSLMLAVDKSQSLEPISITLEGAEYFPSLVDMLERRKIYDKAGANEGEGKAAVDSKITLIIDQQFAQQVNQSEPAKITLRADYSDNSIQPRIDRVRRVIDGYSAQLGAMRLMIRGIAPSVAQPVDLVEQDTSSAQSRAGFYLGMMSTFVLMSVFVASTNVAIDTSAGERERNSLEFLLAQPVQPVVLVLAKTVNTTFFSVVGAGLTLTLMVVVLQFVPLHLIGLDFDFTPWMAILIWIALVPLAAFAAAMQLVTSFLAKTFKEAQSYITLTIMLPMMLPMIILVGNIEHPVLAWLPLTGQTQLISDFLKGVDVNGWALLVSSASSLGLAGLCIAVMARGLKSEKMILGL
ncbi:MAG: sodium transport system permease protein [Phenylobacterium sp.]|jgi:sodium transport system permease protein